MRNPGKVYLWLPGPDLAINRVQCRVNSGGHDVAPEVVERRYHAVLRNLMTQYLPLADKWVVFDNSLIHAPKKIATKLEKGGIRVENPVIWEQIVNRSAR